MKPKSTLRSYLALAGSSLLAISYAQAATQYWSADGVAPGGTGTWSSSFWSAAATGPFASAWTDNNTAVFGGAVGTVTLTDNVSVGGLQFNTNSYIINGETNTKTLNFADGNNSILLGTNGVTVATINGQVGGSVSANVNLSNAAGHYFPALATLTLGLTSTSGWAGTTTINAGTTLSLNGANRGLASTSGITLTGGFSGTTQTGGITLTNTNATQAGFNRVNDSAPIVSNGGFITVTNTASATTVYSEDMGALDLRRGQLNVTQTNANSNNVAPQTLTFGSGSLTTVNSLARTNATTSAVNFSGATLGANVRNSIIITGQGDTNQNEIIAPWATFGATAGAQTDYAVYNRAGSANASTNTLGIQAAAITASDESTWSTAYAATSNYTLANALTSAANGRLNATRSINTLRSTTGRSTVFSIASNVITITGSSFQDNDVMVTTLAAGPTGTTRDTAYYVVNASGDTFQLAATPGGTPLASLSGTGFLTSGITLSSGNNLETYGLLATNSTGNLVVGRGTAGGVLTTPTGGGNLHFTTGGGGIVIDAPITDNGGAVTVVKNGFTGPLVLSGNNSFMGGLVVNSGGSANSVRLVGTQSFTGGITLNGGGIGEIAVNNLVGVAAASLNDNAITVNGASHLLFVDGGSLGASSTITINAAGVLSIGSNGTTGITVNGVVSGSGMLDVGNLNGNVASTVILANSANSFSGNVIYGHQHNKVMTLSVNSIGDSGKVTLGLFGGGSSNVFNLHSTAASDLTFNTRQFELGGAAINNRIGNNSAQAFTINTDLLTSGTGNSTLQLYGNGAGLSTFAGKLANGSLTSLGITKAEAGTWALTNTANSYTGVTTITTGTLRVTSVADYGVASSIGAPTSGAITFGTGSNNTGTLEYTGDGDSTDRQVQIGTIGQTSGSGVILNNGSGALIFDATTFNVTDPTLTGSPGTRNLTLGGSYTGGVNEIQGNIVANALSTRDISVTKTGAGTWKLSGTNGYTGATTVSGGTLELGVDDCLANTSDVLIGAATLKADANVNDTVGTLDATAAATINLGSGATLAFAASNGVDWTGGTLNITGTFVPGNGVDPGVGSNPGSLRFGNTSSGLTSVPVTGQLSKITAPGWTGFGIDAFGYLTATPTGGTTFADWIAGFSVGGQTGINGDFDNDGLGNAVENLMGTNPSVSNQGLTAVSSTGGNLKFRHTLSTTPASDLTGAYEWSVNLSDWNANGASSGGTLVSFGVPVVVTPGTPNLVEVTATVTGTPSAKIFARFKATQP